ncbi:hypothetical protein VTO73DRAFT_5143 [Trametes versicolor]
MCQTRIRRAACCAILASPQRVNIMGIYTRLPDFSRMLIKTYLRSRQFPISIPTFRHQRSGTRRRLETQAATTLLDSTLWPLLMFPGPEILGPSAPWSLHTAIL